MGGFKGLKRCSFCDYSHKFSSQVRRHEQQAHGDNARQCTVSGCGKRVPYNRLARHIRQCHFDALKVIDTSSATLDGLLAEEAQTDALEVMGQRQKRMEQQREEEKERDEQKESEKNEQRKLDQCRDENSPSSDVSSSAGPSPSLSASPLSVGVVPIAQLALGQHECVKCGQRKATREALRRHIARVHDKRYTKPKREKRHHCEWEGCGKSFTTQGLLEDHVNGHTGNCPFSCDHCKRTFSARAQFVRHLRKYHAVSIRQMDRHIDQIVDLTSE